MKILPLLFPWLARRGLELGGLMVAISAIDPFILQGILATVGALLIGDWESISLGALAGMIATISGLVWNATSTFRDQVVKNGDRVVGKDLTYGQDAMVETVVAEAKRNKRPTLLDRLFHRR